MKVNIKDVKVGQVVQFERHAHQVLNDELICDFMFGTVMQDMSHNGKGWNGQVIINLHNSEHIDKLKEFDTGLGQNNLVFLFPDDDDMYHSTSVTIINEKPKITYAALVPVVGSMRVTVKASSPEEALKLLKEGEYEDADDFCLGDCNTCEEDLTLEDIDEL